MSVTLAIKSGSSTAKSPARNQGKSQRKLRVLSEIEVEDGSIINMEFSKPPEMTMPFLIPTAPDIEPLNKGYKSNKDLEEAKKLTNTTKRPTKSYLANPSQHNYCQRIIIIIINVIITVSHTKETTLYESE